MIPNPIIPSNPMRGAVNKTSERALFDAAATAVDQLSGASADLERDNPKQFYGRIAEALFVLRNALATPAPEPQPEVAAEPVAWDVQEFKIWKGIDPDKSVWAGRGFCCSTWAAANDLMEYLQHNCPELLLRVVPNRHSSLPLATPAEPIAWRCEDQILKGVVSIIEDREHVEMRRETGAWEITPLYAAPPVVEEAVKAEPIAWVDPERIRVLHERKRWTTAILADAPGENATMPIYAAPPARSATP